MSSPTQDLLFLSQRIPYPPTKGDKIRSYHILRHLSERYRVHLGCFVDDVDDWKHLPVLKHMTASMCLLPLNRHTATIKSLTGLLTGEALSLPYYRDRQMARWVRRILAQVRPRTAFLFSSVMAQYVLGHPDRPPRVVMDFVDVDSQKWRQYSARRRWPMAELYDRESRLLLAFERQVAAAADASVFVSGPEADLFRSLAPESAGRVQAIANGIDTTFFAPDHRFASPFGAGTRPLVFTGAMDYWPNVEAVSWFATDILPHIRSVEPNAQFWIVGSHPSPAVQSLAALPAVSVTGRVKDVRPYLAHADVVVAPVVTTQGIQNKVLEGMAMARPVVATPEAQEGLLAEDGRHLRVADTTEAFASAVLGLLSDRETAMKIGEAARRHVLENYDWPSRFAEWERLLESQ